MSVTYKTLLFTTKDLTMKKYCLKGILVMLFCVGWQSSFAQVSGISYTLSPTVENVWWDDQAGIEDGLLFGGKFGLGFGEQCNVPMRMDFSTDLDSTFYQQAAEVMLAGDRLTDEQREISLFWIDTPGITGAPSGHWVLIEIQLVEQMELNLARASEMYILVGTALGDAFISAWNLKYQDNLVRPVTYIQANLRRNWSPFVETPPFPEYPSGHSVVSGAAAEVLTTMFGQVAFTDRTPILNGHQSFERSFTSFEAAASEAAISRLYGGIHYAPACFNGVTQGEKVGDFVVSRVKLKN